jgi:3-methyladenine DNA glycosylase AlkD
LSAPSSGEPSLSALQAELRELADPEDTTNLLRFFKTGPGEYGEGDRFLGIRVPILRRLSRSYRALPLLDIFRLLRSPWHEERFLSLLLLVATYARAGESAQKEIFDFYLAHTRYINGWDLVDTSAEHIVGPRVNLRTVEPLVGLSRSQLLWDRRIAILATFHWIKQGEFRPTLEIAERLLGDSHDLIHKAAGWMLREVGERDRRVEEAFLTRHHRVMPRTMLRYALERFPEDLRRTYLGR